MNGHVYQVDGEPGKRPNQFKKTTKQVWQIVMWEWDSPHLFETILRDRKPPDLKELEYPGDEAPKNRIFKWEYDMKHYMKTKDQYEDGLFSLWSLIDN